MSATLPKLLMSGMLVLLAIPVLATTYTTPSQVITSEKFTKKDIRAMRREVRADATLCNRIARNRKALDRIFSNPKGDTDQLERVADKIWKGTFGCKRDRALAIIVTERIVGNDLLHTQNWSALRRLADFHGEFGTKESLSRAQYLEQFIYVRADIVYDYRAQENLKWSASERRAFIASAPIWEFIKSKAGAVESNRQARLMDEALIDPLSPRHDPEKYIARVEASKYRHNDVAAARLLIEGKKMPRDLARAEKLLLPQAQFDDVARQLIFPILSPRLDSPDVTVRDVAVKQLAGWGQQIGPGAAAMRARVAPFVAQNLAAASLEIQKDALQTLTQFVLLGSNESDVLLMSWLEMHLTKGTDQEKGPAWASLSRLALAGKPAALKLLEADMTRTYGAVDGGQLTLADGNLARIITPNDYPSRAIRNEEEGRVEASVIIAPDGRIVGSFVTQSSGSAILDSEVLKVTTRRARLMSRSRPGRYVKAKLPPVVFTLNRCEKEPPPTQQPAGVLVVVGECFIEIVSDRPIPVTAISSAKHN
jgi:TonB family protein